MKKRNAGKNALKIAYKLTEIYLLFYYIVFTGFRFMMIEDQSLYYLGIVTFVLLAIWLVYMIATGEIPGFPPYLGIYLFFLLSYGTSVFRSIYLPGSIYESLLLSIVVFLFIGIMSVVKYGRDRGEIVNSLLWVGLIYNGLKAIQFVQNWASPGCGVKNILIPNKTAGFLNLTIMLAFGVLIERIYSFTKRSAKVRIDYLAFPGVVYLSSVALLWFAGSRSGLVSFFAGSVIVLLFHWWYSGRGIVWRELVIVVALLAGFVSSSVLLNKPILCAPGVSNTAWTSSIDHRFELWGDALEIVRARPLVGSGPGTFEYIVGPKYDRIGSGKHAHNIYLQTMAERGLLGFVIMFFVFVTIYKTVSMDRIRVMIRLVGVGVLVVVLVQGLADSVMADAPFVMRYFVSILAVVLSPGENSIAYRKLLESEYYG